MRTNSGFLGGVALGCALLGTVACTSDDATKSGSQGDGGPDGSAKGGSSATGGAIGSGGSKAGTGGGSAGAGGSKGGAGGANAGGSVASGGSSTDAGEKDASAGGQGTGGAADAGPEAGLTASINFAVPSGGGQLPFTLANGHVITFDFPASAAGQNVRLTPSDATNLGWPAGQFDDVIQMEPDGLTFADPIVIRPASGSLLALDFKSSGSKSAPDGLPLNAAKDGLELRHFSTLALVPAGKSCDSTSGWTATANDQRCSTFGAATKYIDYACKGYNFCQIIMAHCCALPGATECELGDANLSLTYIRSDGNGTYPYCVATPDGGADSGGAFVTTPSFAAMTPNHAAAATVITASGTDWAKYYAQNSQVDFPIDAHFYVAGVEKFDAATPYSGPTVTASAGNRNQATFPVPNLTPGVYDVAIRFRNGTLTSNTLPFTIE